MQGTKKTAFDRMKKENLDTVFRAIVEHRPISRIGISQQTGLNKMTVTNCVKNLLEQGMVREVEAVSNAVGRPPILLDLNGTFGVMAGIELNIISSKVLVLDFAGNVLKKETITEEGWEPDRFVKYIERYVEKLSALSERYRNRILGIGIAIPGNYNDLSGCVEYISNMQSWNGYPIRETLTKELPGTPVFIQNAGRAGAKGEIDFGASCFEDDMTYIQGSMGLALSMYSKNGMYAGHRGFNGRFGHNIIVVGGKKCICGNRGCLEMYASIHSLCDTLYPGETVTDEMIQTVIRRKQSRDQEVCVAVEECVRYLAVGLANMINCFNPRRVCIGNYLGMILTGEEEFLNREVDRYLLPHYQESRKIFISTLKEWGAAFGAAATVRDRVSDQ